MADGAPLYGDSDYKILNRYFSILEKAEAKGLKFEILEKEKKFRISAGKWIIDTADTLSWIERTIDGIKIGDEKS